MSLEDRWIRENLTFGTQQSGANSYKGTRYKNNEQYR